MNSHKQASDRTPVWPIWPAWINAIRQEGNMVFVFARDAENRRLVIPCTAHLFGSFREAWKAADWVQPVGYVPAKGALMTEYALCHQCEPETEETP